MTALAAEFPVGLDADVIRELCADDLEELAACEGADYAPLAKAELRRRADLDRARLRRRTDPVAVAWHEAAYAQYLQAETELNGVLCKPGTPAGFDPWALWSGPMWRAERYASWELLRFWEVNRRLTVSEYREQARASREEETMERDPFAGMPNADDAENEGYGPPLEVDDSGDVLPSYADVTPLDQEWLWEGFIPFGKVTLIAGDSGIGKGFMLSNLAARVSRGDAMPDGSPGNPPGHVIMITPEDDPRTCTVHRLRSHGADLGMVHDLTIVNGNVWCIQEDINELRRQIAACGGASLVVIDPISAVTLVGLTSDVPVRRKVLGPLEAVARETGCAIVVIGHLTKTGAAAAQKNRAAAKDGMGGTKGLSNAARIMLTVVRDDADPRIRTLAVVKSNGTDDKAGAAVRYTIQGTPPRVEWLGDAGEAPGKGEGQEAAVLRAMRDLGPGPHHMRQVAAKAAVPYDSARMAASRLERRGELAHRGQQKSGLYALASEVDALEEQVTQLAARRGPDPGLPLPAAWAELSAPVASVRTRRVGYGQEARR